MGKRIVHNLRLEAHPMALWGFITAWLTVALLAIVYAITAVEMISTHPVLSDLMNYGGMVTVIWWVWRTECRD